MEADNKSKEVKQMLTHLQSGRSVVNELIGEIVEILRNLSDKSDVDGKSNSPSKLYEVNSKR